MAENFRVTSNANVKRAPDAEERTLTELASKGLVTRGEGTLTTFRPLRIAGKPLAETLLEDRNDRL
jgi:hypothetical protein